MLPILQIGPAAIQLPMLLILGGVWLGSALAERAGRRAGLPPGQLEALIFTALVAGVIGARLGHVLQFLDIYVQDPLAVLALTPVTLAPEVGAAVAGIAALVDGQRRRLALWPTLDALSVGAAGVAVAMALAHLAGGDAYGAPANLPWAIHLYGALRHPSQVYEALAAGAILAAIVGWRPRTPRPGRVFGVFVGMSAAARLILEAFRGDSLLLWGGIRAAQVVSLIALLAALVLLRRLGPPRPSLASVDAAGS
jgi:phosphatidylglycerol:prolipoprotein diacylglycerol transferase